MPPAFSSQSFEPTQVMLLSSPPLPLHCDVASQVIATGPADVAWQLAAEVQASEQPAASHVAWQSVPALHAHSFPAEQEHPMPLHVAVVAPPLQDATATASTTAASKPAARRRRAADP